MAKIDVLAGIRWKRCTAAAHEGSQGEPAPHARAYQSRLLKCNLCNGLTETAHMQLRTTNGYRSISCRVCHNHRRVGRSKCVCEVLWHQCTTHRVDPAVHRTTKAKRKREANHTIAHADSPLTREAPYIRTNACAWKRREGKRTKVLHQPAVNATCVSVR